MCVRQERHAEDADPFGAEHPLNHVGESGIRCDREVLDLAGREDAHGL